MQCYAIIIVIIHKKFFFNGALIVCNGLSKIREQIVWETYTLWFFGSDLKFHIFSPGNNTFDANEAVHKSQLAQILYEGYCQGASSLPSWTVFLNSVYRILHITFSFGKGTTHSDKGILNHVFMLILFVTTCTIYSQFMT